MWHHRLMAGFAAALLACAGSGQTGANDPALSALEREVFDAVNQYRSEQGLPILIDDPGVVAVARRHSRVMAAGDAPLGHAGFRDRAAEISDELALASMAENVARYDRAPAEIPAVALRAWLDSDVHRRNIRGDHQRSGVGAARSPGGSVFLTQIFVGVQPDPAAIR